MVRPLPVMVSAFNIEFRTASSVASRTASNRGERASAGRVGRGVTWVAPWATRSSFAVEKATAKSPLPFEYDEPVRARPNTALAASLSRSRGERGASVATTIMQDPSALSGPPPEPARAYACRPISFPTGTPSTDRTPPKFDCTSTPTTYPDPPTGAILDD